jgi:hypothetical protein
MRGMLVRPHMAAYCHYLPGPAVVAVHSEFLGKVFGKAARLLLGRCDR